MLDLEYFQLPVAFQFIVVPLNPLKAAAVAGMALAGMVDDTAFQEVSGLESNMEVDAYNEGGENRFVHHLPTKMTHGNLQLKRGVAPITSPLVLLCKATLEGGLSAVIERSDLLVSLLDEDKVPIRAWAVYDTFAVKWQVDGFTSTKNEVAIEQIELAYSYCERMI